MTNNQKKDVKYNWHPYTQHKISNLPIVITKGKDALLWDEHGNEYIDAIGSWWCNPHGHCNPTIANAIYQQLNTLEHVLFGGFTHPTAIELSEKLLAVLPENQQKIFYSDNGSTAVEVGIKMALQYFHNQNLKKDCIIAFEGAFHGDTFAAMAASGITFFTESFKDFFLSVERIPIPTDENIEVVLSRVNLILKNRKPAAFVYECLVQGAAGMKIIKPEYLNLILQKCKEHNVLNIADEVMTGFGRTGTLFASEQISTQPDIICLSKALTGGFIPMAVTSCTNEIYNAFLDEEVEKALFHGHTFMANPAGCAAALASLKLTLSKETQENIQRIYQQHQIFEEKLKQRSDLENIKVLGVILRFDIKTDYEEEDFYGTLRNKLYQFYIENKVILRPVGNSVYILPPYCITNEQLKKVYNIIWRSIELIKNG